MTEIPQIARETMTTDVANVIAAAPRLSFRRDIALSDTADGLLLRWSGGETSMKRLSRGMRDAFLAIAGASSTEDGLADVVSKSDGVGGLTELYAYLAQFDRFGMLCRSVVAKEKILATLVPFSPSYRFRFTPVDAEKEYVLSRFAYWRREGEHLVIESPRSHARLELYDDAAVALLATFAKPQLPPATGRSVGAASSPVVGVPLVDQLLLLGLAAGADLLIADPESEDAQAPLGAWDFHDLLFHTRSRMGRHANRTGATYGRRTMFEPLPAAKPPLGGESIDLPSPEIERLIDRDVPFTQVLEDRRSIKTYDDEHPITIEELGEFLYRSARIRRIVPPQPEFAPYETSSRVAPSGGASHDLELYLTVRLCAGLGEGFYHYDPLHHRLERIASDAADTSRLLADATQATGGTGVPQVLITLASRFQRLSWKYESIAYAITLKNTGVLLQTMYLVATAMGLAPSALGNGNSDLFASMAGTDYFAETSVGEFILGSRGR